MTKKLWMYVSSKGQFAPGYGIAYTRKELEYAAIARGLKMTGYRPVRVTVTSAAVRE